MGVMKRLHEQRIGKKYPKRTVALEPEVYNVSDHLVTKTNGKWHCSCKDFQFRHAKTGTFCKHILQVS